MALTRGAKLAAPKAHESEQHGATPPWDAAGGTNDEPHGHETKLPVRLDRMAPNSPGVVACPRACLGWAIVCNMNSGLTLVLHCGTSRFMRLKHKRTLELIFSRPASSNIRWDDIVSLFRELGAEIKEREGSRVEVFLFGQVRVYHRPHPRPNTDKGAVAAIRRWLEQHGVTP